MNPWKATTIGIALVTGTAFTTGLTTAYFMRPARDTEARSVRDARELEARPMTAPPAIRYATAGRVLSAPVPGAPAPATSPHATAPYRVAQPAEPVAGRAAVECGTTGERVWRTAKPGLVGALLGAGLGAASGAVADGGKGAQQT